MADSLVTQWTTACRAPQAKILEWVAISFSRGSPQARAWTYITCMAGRYSSPPGSSVHGILQARILEWVAISFSRGSSPPRDRTRQADTLLSEPPGNLQNEDIQLDPLDPSRAKSLCLYVKVFDAFPLIAWFTFPASTWFSESLCSRLSIVKITHAISNKWA